MTKFQFESDNYFVLPVEEVERLKCLKQEYSRGIPYVLAKDKFKLT